MNTYRGRLIVIAFLISMVISQDVQKYDINKIQRLTSDFNGAQAKVADTAQKIKDDKDRQQQEALVKKLQEDLKNAQSALQLKEKQLAEAMNQKRLAIQKQKQEQRLQAEKKRQQKLKNSKAESSTTTPQLNKENSPQSQQQQTPTPQKPTKSHIAYLTPQNILANKKIQDTTIMIIILVCSILGSIFLTAIITAVIMKKRHKSHVRRRIKNNAEMHSDITTEHSAGGPQKAENKSQIQI